MLLLSPVLGRSRNRIPNKGQKSLSKKMSLFKELNKYILNCC